MDRERQRISALKHVQILEGLDRLSLTVHVRLSHGNSGFWILISGFCLLTFGERAPTVCRHPVSGLFHSPRRGAFHLSLTVLVRYRSHTST